MWRDGGLQTDEADGRYDCYKPSSNAQWQAKLAANISNKAAKCVAAAYESLNSRQISGSNGWQHGGVA